jgi:acetyl esterase/lipase
MADKNSTSQFWIAICNVRCMTKTLLGSLFLAATLSVTAQTNSSFPLWPDGAPGALGKEAKDIPTLTLFLPAADKATGAAMVICPGGGYGGLADHEGSHYARWLNQQGIAGFVLKYRLGSGGYRHPIMLHDAARALRIVRARAEEWKLDSKRIGIMGSSAGGHLASTLVTHFDAGKPDATDPIERVSSRPGLGILCYPVISMGEHSHQGSKKNLLGENPSAELVRELSNELQVTKDTPPCFIWHTWEDKGVKIENALSFANALQAADVRFDLHVYERGPHGLGLGSRDYDPVKWHPWTRDCAFWLKERGFTKN